MGGSGCAVHDSLVFSSPCDDVFNLVLVGKTGDGKSATGNSIIGGKVFDSMHSLGGVTTTSQMHTTRLEDGQILNVIDTPGLFDTSVKNEHIAKEIAKCITMANNGIHAILVVLSVRNRFSQEEEAVVKTLQQLFGEKIADYMIVVFSGGDELGNDASLDSFLGRCLPESLAKILEICGNRRVLFDNKTEDESKKSKQVKELISLVNTVVEKNEGMPYTNEHFVELKIGDLKIADQTGESNEALISKRYEELLNRYSEMVESRLREAEKRLADEQAAQLLAEEKAKAAQEEADKKLQEAHRKMRDEIQAARLLAEEKAKAAQKEADKKLQEAHRKMRDEIQAARLLAEEKAKAAQKEADRKLQEAHSKMRDEIHNRQREIEALRRSNCSIM